MNQRLIRSALAFSSLAIVTALASCAGGPGYAETKATLPPIPKGHGRVFVYRPSTFGAAIRPDVKIDGKVAGTSQGRGFFYSDQTAGNHSISITTEWTHTNTFNVSSGKPTFIRCKVTPGLLAGHIIPDQVPAAQGEEEIQNCYLSE